MGFGLLSNGFTLTSQFPVSCTVNAFISAEQRGSPRQKVSLVIQQRLLNKNQDEKKMERQHLFYQYLAFNYYYYKLIIVILELLIFLYLSRTI